MPTVLTALVSLALTGTAQASPSPLAGCEATPVKYGWQYDCADLRARIEDRPEVAGQAAMYLEGMQEGLTSVVGDGAVTRRVRRKIGGVDAEVHIVEAPGKPFAGFALSVPGKLGTRVLVCIGRDERCGSVLTDLSRVPWGGPNVSGSISRPSAPLVLAGRSISAPKECESSTQPRGGRIACGSRAWVQWSVGDEGQVRRAREGNGRSIRATLAKNGMTGMEDEVPCRMAGKETTCGRVIITAQGQNVLMLWGAVPAGDDFVFAQCMTPGGPEIRSPCALVFAPQ